MKIKYRAKTIHVYRSGNLWFTVAVFCGERWYKISSWRRYTLFGKLVMSKGFHVGPIMFWDGS